MPKIINPINPESVSLPLREGAKLAGCSFDTIKRAVDAGELLAFKMGRGNQRGKWFVKRATLLAWIDKLEETGGV